MISSFIEHFITTGNKNIFFTFCLRNHVTDINVFTWFKAVPKTRYHSKNFTAFLN